MIGSFLVLFTSISRIKADSLKLQLSQNFMALFITKLFEHPCLTTFLLVATGHLCFRPICPRKQNQPEVLWAPVDLCCGDRSFLRLAKLSFKLVFPWPLIFSVRTAPPRRAILCKMPFLVAIKTFCTCIMRLPIIYCSLLLRIISLITTSKRAFSFSLPMYPPTFVSFLPKSFSPGVRTLLNNWKLSVARAAWPGLLICLWSIISRPA